MILIKIILNNFKFINFYKFFTLIKLNIVICYILKIKIYYYMRFNFINEIYYFEYDNK